MAIELPTELTNLLSAETIVIVAVVALAGLVALALLQGAGLRRRVDDMLQEDTAAYATLRTAAERVARIEAGTLPTGHEDLRIAVSPELSERLEEAARRGGVSLMTAARAALERGLASEEAERRQPRELAAPAAMAVEPVERNGH
ncbi:MAG: hypothetical protein OXJ90_13625 [Spirochaetaceae bacterium]|nr:hypothetical protein [Spirochaetaceae bacterium]